MLAPIRSGDVARGGVFVMNAPTFLSVSSRGTAIGIRKSCAHGALFSLSILIFSSCSLSRRFSAPCLCAPNHVHHGNHGRHNCYNNHNDNNVEC